MPLSSPDLLSHPLKPPIKRANAIKENTNLYLCILSSLQFRYYVVLLHAQLQPRKKKISIITGIGTPISHNNKLPFKPPFWFLLKNISIRRSFLKFKQSRYTLRLKQPNLAVLWGVNREISRLIWTTIGFATTQSAISKSHQRRRSNSTTIMMTTTRPIEPPPSQTPLPKCRSITFLSFSMAMYLPSLSMDMLCDTADLSYQV